MLSKFLRHILILNPFVIASAAEAIYSLFEIAASQTPRNDYVFVNCKLKIVNCFSNLFYIYGLVIPIHPSFSIARNLYELYKIPRQFSQESRGEIVETYE